jgi:hypothetical protein
MRGGALPLLAWACLLALLLAGNWVWTGDAIQIGEFGFAVLLVLVAAAVLAVSHRSAIRRGPPEPPPRARVEAAPDLSFAAVLAAIAVASILFGLTWAYFLVYFGGGLLLLSLGRLAQELQAARASRERYEKRPLPDAPKEEDGT